MAIDPDLQAAVDRINNLPYTPPNNTLLEVYALYKQATSGDVQGKRPGMLNVRGRAKYDAYAKRKGMSKADAAAAYIALSEKLAQNR
jgi:diazepam-binding inhibitor (GABA receptor modulator, acyl-CoA-binding protein)